MNTLLRRKMMMCKRNWLTPSTIQTINTAFGNDGYKVVNATNDYLNGIALTDMNKATNLAGYINEDAMLVCSIGIEPQGVTMPIRWLVGDGAAIIDTGFAPADVTKLSTDLIAINKVRSTNVTQWVFGYLYGGSPFTQYTMYYGNTSNVNNFRTTIRNDAYLPTPSSIDLITDRETIVEVLDFKNGSTCINNNLYTYPTSTPYNSNGVTIAINGAADNRQSSGYRPGSNPVGNVLIRYDGTIIYNMLPFILGSDRDSNECYPNRISRAGEIGRINIVTGIFYPNANTSGSFTIEYTLQDGKTPWTPQT